MSSKSSSVEHEETKVSSLPSNLVLKHFTTPTTSTDDHKDFLMKRFLNSDDNHFISVDNNHDEKCFSNPRKCSDASEETKDDSQNNNFNVSKEILSKLEEAMLHNNLSRDSFRVRSATKNFVLNPLFEDKLLDNSNNHTPLHQTNNNQKNETLKPSKLATSSENFNSNKSDINMLEASKANCVENVFVNLIKIRRANSLKDVDEEAKSNFAKKRCNSFRRLD